MKAIEFTVKSLVVAVSVMCIFITPAAFTPAVFLSFSLLLVAGIAGGFGHLVFAIILVGTSSVAISVSVIIPAVLADVSNTIVAVLPVIVGYGGIAAGVIRARKDK